MRRAKRKNPWVRQRVSDRGQVTILVVIALSMFLLGFVGFAVDMTNLWFHRQMAQGAADAACQAGIMNVLVHTSTQGFTPGASFNCAGSPTATPCRYAALNGYNGSGLAADTPSSEVAVSFPGTVAGYDPTILPPTGLAPFPFLRVDVTDRVKVFFSPLITGRLTQDVHAQAICGLTLAKAPIPIIILNPTCSRSLLDSGSGKVTVVGGPTRSVQVNSSNNCAAALSSSGCVTSSPTTCTSSPPPAASCAPSNAAIDLTQGGPNFTGSSLGVFGGPNNWGGGFWTGPSATWGSPVAPIADPYADLPPPDRAAAAALRTISSCGSFDGADHEDNYGEHGCPDHTKKCRHYAPGLYRIPLVIKNRTAIFDPGTYYIEPASYSGYCQSGFGNVCPSAACTDVGSITGCDADFIVATGGVVRQAKGTSFPGATGEGTMFYLSSGVTGRWGSVALVQGAGSYSAGQVDDYDPTGASATSAPAQCSGDPSTPNPPLPSTLKGNVLLGACTGTYGDQSCDPTTGACHPIRGMLFFQDRANNRPDGQANLQGGGGLLLAGTLYFHNCPNSPDCSPGYNTTYNGLLQLQGNPGSDTRVVGNITVDSLNLSGNGSIDMVLDPNRVRPILRATLVR
jgi:hypothetical protein